MNMTLEEFTQYVEKNPTIDKKLDSKIIEIAQKGNVIIDSQLSAYILKSIADYKILLTCSLETRIKRMSERDSSNYEKKLKETILREKSELERFKRLYNIDLKDQGELSQTYDFIINTENLTIEDVLKKILTFLKNK